MSTPIQILNNAAEAVAWLRSRVQGDLQTDSRKVKAGDAFVAGLLAGLAAHGIPDNLAALAPDLTLAQTCGALATTAKGAMTALPYKDDLQRSL